MSVDRGYLGKPPGLAANDMLYRSMDDLATATSVNTNLNTNLAQLVDTPKSRGVELVRLLRVSCCNNYFCNDYIITKYGNCHRKRKRAISLRKISKLLSTIAETTVIP